MPKVGDTDFPYTKQGMQEAKAWSVMTGRPMQKRYKDGGSVHLRDTRQVLDPSTLEEAAHLRVPGGTAARYTAKTKGGDERHLTRFIEGEGGKAARRKSQLDMLRYAMQMNPDFADTVSKQQAIDFMNPEKNKVDIIKLLLNLLPKDKDVLKVLGETPKYANGGLASKGRFGDTKMRKVNGELSHVNPTEAKWIDNYGPLGQKLTEALGSGTINPMTGLPEYGWFKKAKKWWNKNVKPIGKAAHTYWNKNVKPIGKQNLWHGLGSTLALVDPTNITSLATCLGQGKNYADCVRYRGEQGLSSLWMNLGDKQPKFDPNNPNAHFDIPDIPLHTGVDVTTGWDPESGMTEAEYNAIVEANTDNTTFGTDGAPTPPLTPPPTPEEKKYMPWLYAKGKGDESNLLALVNQMVGEKKPKEMKRGGLVPGKKMNMGYHI